ncbi:MAG: AAA family ATPase [Rickettsiaceae bacterium]|nr:AAA family ATPase [Rickettsiaceae bacterium]
MKYKSFKITNYKGIEDLEISFAEGNLILSGLNESGKTTVLDAINNWGLMTKKQYLENGKKCSTS